MKDSKRRYIQPLIDEYSVDKDIALVLMSPDPGDPNVPPGDGDLPGATSAQQTTPFEETSLDENNFK